MSVKWITISAGLIGSFSALLPAVPLGMFSVDAESDLFSAARVLLIAALATQMAEGLQNVSVGVLRGFGDTSSSLRFSLVGYWVVGLPSALLLAFSLHLGAVGMWLGITAGLVFIAVALQLRIRNETRSLQCRSGATG
jgi:MATE family multidrug resistance protein